jgi:hypothetical protein
MILKNKHKLYKLNTTKQKRPLTGQSRRISPGFDLPVLPVSTPYSPPSTATNIRISLYEINSGKTYLF